jgi:hypothetical protein
MRMNRESKFNRLTIALGLNKENMNAGKLGSLFPALPIQ